MRSSFFCSIMKIKHILNNLLTLTYNILSRQIYLRTTNSFICIFHNHATLCLRTSFCTLFSMTNNFSLSTSSFSPQIHFHPTRNTYSRAKAEVDRLAPYKHDIFHPPDRCSVLRKIGSYQNIVVTVRCRVFQIAAVPSMHS